jgi:hypothetical protein
MVLDPDWKWWEIRYPLGRGLKLVASSLKRQQ